MPCEQSWTETQVWGGHWFWGYVFPGDTSNNGYLTIFLNFHFGGYYKDIGLWVSEIIPTLNCLVFTIKQV